MSRRKRSRVRKLQDRHALERALQRYDALLSPEAVDEICKIIRSSKKGKRKFIRKSTNTASEWLVEYEGTWYRCIYCRGKKRIRTFLPMTEEFVAKLPKEKEELDIEVVEEDMTVPVKVPATEVGPTEKDIVIGPAEDITEEMCKQAMERIRETPHPVRSIRFVARITRAETLWMLKFGDFWYLFDYRRGSDAARPAEFEIPEEATS